MTNKTREIRDPIHGFIPINDWEWDIINHHAFQRLKRIKQLAFTDMVYPGASHSRFEHSLGVMHIATQMFDRVVKKSKDFLQTEMCFDDVGLEKDKVLVRLAALLHDVGHSPFSHAGEGTMAENPKTGEPYDHEDYSAAIIELIMKDVIEGHKINWNYEITAKEISDFLKGDSSLKRRLLWRPLITGQFDADRADYLLRDSYHIGVQYGKYDLHRLIATMTIVVPKGRPPTIGVEYGGFHAAESLIAARYLMFTQVYFHHTRRAYDHHISETLNVLLHEEQKGSATFAPETFPPPINEKNVNIYLEWDDWKVHGLIKEGKAKSPGSIILNRNHDRTVYQTSEVPTEEEWNEQEEVTEALKDKISFIDLAEKSWYKIGSTDLSIIKEDASNEVNPLSNLSSIVKGLRPIKQMRIYVPSELQNDAKKLVQAITKSKGGENVH